MPHKKGRARNTVPQQYNKATRKAQRPAADSRPTTPQISWTCPAYSSILHGDPETLPLPPELWLRVADFANAWELCRGEEVNRAARQAVLDGSVAVWESLCQLEFHSMWCSVRQSGSLSNPTSPEKHFLSSPLQLPSSPGLMPELILPPASEDVGDKLLDASGPSSVTPMTVQHDWKRLYARRWLKQLEWDVARGRARSSSDASSASLSTSGQGGNRRICAACGERFTPVGTPDPSSRECLFHHGEFLPRCSLPGRSLDHLDTRSTFSEWSVAELQQLQVLVRAAWRSVGGAAGVALYARNYRGGGHWAKHLGFKGWGSRGHWAEGCGPRPGSHLIRECVNGHIPCAWSCCGAEDLISQGCSAGVHK